NTFEYCAYSGAEHSVLNISPRLGKSFNTTISFDRNIRFENNIIRTFDSRIVRADRVEGFIIKNNKIINTNQTPKLYPNAPLIELINCHKVTIVENSYEGEGEKIIKSDEQSSKSLYVKDNKGFQ
ncbi:MAG TPA: hypothetical protein PKD85_06255, partial [Saprospiraceae bacterium]|nr:hypothetical protein [Saprospiraceae bacterium]